MQTPSSSIARINLVSRTCINCAGASAGPSTRRYAYLLLPREMMTVGAARKRISAIKQYSSLGAGFRIAMRDLEIRGAGSILGTAQSGHIIAIGFDLYCQLLKQAVTQLKGEKPRFRLDVDLNA